MSIAASTVEFVVPQIEWLALIPVMIVLGTAAIAVLLEAFISGPEVRRYVQLPLAVVALLAAAAFIVVQWATMDGDGLVVASRMVVIDRQVLIWQAMIVIFGIVGVLLFADRTREREEAFAPLGAAAPGSSEETVARAKGLQITEVFPLALFAIGGMMLFVAVTDLIFLFVALELFSLPLYLLVALARRRRLLSHEASVKYFLLGAFASAMFLFGAALAYGLTGDTDLRSFGWAIAASPGDIPLAVLAAVLLLAGLFFKLGAVPFHLWVPDTYQGAPTPVTAFMSAATKAAATAVIVRLSALALYRLEWELNWFVWTVAIISMLIGTFLAIVQTDVKRMLAYSSIAHAGFIVVALAGFTGGMLTALPVYLLTYGLASLGAFAVVTQVRELTADGAVGAEATRLGQWAGLGKRHPLLAGAMSLFLLSFAGIPLTAGFIGKFVTFRAAIEGGAWPLVIVAVLASAAAAFFYVRLVVLMFLTDAPEDTTPRVDAAPTVIGRSVIVAMAALILLLGVAPAPLLDLAEDAGTVYVPAPTLAG